MLEKDYVIVKDLKLGDVITVKTMNHEYRLKVINPTTAEVEVSSENNPLVPRPRLMHVLYSISPKGEGGGTATRVGIIKKQRLVMDKLVTSVIQKIFLEKNKIPKTSA